MQISETNDPSAVDDRPENRSHILLRPGPFTTPRAVYKSICFSKRTAAQQNFREIVKELEADGLGSYAEFGRNESAYYKPVLVQYIRAKIEPHFGEASWEEYCTAFKAKESEKMMSSAQQQRLLMKTPDVEKLREYGF